MRIGGLASGMDTDQIVRDLMRVQRMPLDKLTQEKQQLQWKMDGYRELNTLMTKFRDNIFDTVMRSANMTAKKVTSSNPSFVTATAAANAATGSYSISKVSQLATAATNASSGALSADSSQKIDPTKSVASQMEFFQAGQGDAFEWKEGTVRKENVTLTSAQSTVTLNKNDADLKEVVSVKVNGKSYSVVTDREAELGADQVFLDTATGELDFGKVLNSQTKIDVTYVTDSEEKYFTSSLSTFNAQGEMKTEFFAFSGEKTLNQVFNEINASSAGVSMFYDEFSDKVSVLRKETGNFNVGGATSAAVEARAEAVSLRDVAEGFNPADTSEEAVTARAAADAAEAKAAAIEGKEMIFEGAFFTNILQLNSFEEKAGENAKFTINGLETERNSNTFTLNGVTITLRDTFDGPPANLTINTDTDKVFDTIVGFVNEYNEMLDKVNGKLTEEYYRDFKPLTEEQKEAMSEKDIERWEEKAMSGLLRRDSTLSAGLDRLRADIYNPVTANNNNPNIRQLTDLGITTSRDYMQRGKLEIDEDKLRAAIEKDPEGVFNLFTTDGETNADKGIARRMRDSLQETMRAVSERAGGSFGKLQNHQFTLGRNMNDIDTRISNFERRLQQVEDRYWKQFTAMEKAMQQANSQAEQMYSMLFGNQQ